MRYVVRYMPTLVLNILVMSTMFFREQVGIADWPVSYPAQKFVAWALVQGFLMG